MPDHPRYLLELEALPGEVPPEVRLRRLLKTLLRGYGMRCVSIRKAEEPAPAHHHAPHARPQRQPGDDS